MIETSQKTRPKSCLNCNANVAASDCYCCQCGQRIKSPHISLWNLIGDFVTLQFSIEGRLFQTLKTLLFFPGRLTVEYWNGRRARYFSPIQVYLVTSVIFFLLLDAVGSLTGQSPVQVSGADIPKEVAKLGQEEFGISLGFRSVKMNKEQFLEFVETDPAELGTFFEAQGIPMDSVSLYFAYIAHEIVQPGGTEQFVIKYFDTFSKAVIVLMPVYGFILYGLYWRKSENSVKCIVFSAHFHAFAFIILVAMSVLQAFKVGEFLMPLLGLAMMTYLVCALKVVFKGSFWAACLKAFLSTLCYLVCVLGLVVLLIPIVFITL